MVFRHMRSSVFVQRLDKYVELVHRLVCTMIYASGRMVLRGRRLDQGLCFVDFGWWARRFENRREEISMDLWSERVLGKGTVVNRYMLTSYVPLSPWMPTWQA